MGLIIPGQNSSTAEPAFSGQIINGVAHFVEGLAPGFRKNAAGQNIGPLVDGDLWYNPTTGVQAFRRAPYWLSVDTFPIAFPSVATVNLATVTSSPVYVPYGVFWESLSLTLSDTSGTAGSDEASIGLVEILARSQANGTGSTRFTVFSQNIGMTGILPNIGNPNATRTINFPVLEPSIATSVALSYVFTVYGVGINPGVRLSVKARWIL